MKSSFTAGILTKGLHKSLKRELKSAFWQNLPEAAKTASKHARKVGLAGARRSSVTVPREINLTHDRSYPMDRVETHSGCQYGREPYIGTVAMKQFVVLLLAAVCAFSADKEPTAFELVKEGNRYVGEQAKDRLVQVRSEKSIGSLSPKVWYVVYYDPTATFKAVEVKFAAGKMIDVKRPFRVIETVSSTSREMDKTKLKIDSDTAIERALKEPMLENIKVKSIEAKLENASSGPIWQLRLWAEKIQRSRQTADIGKIVLTADEGKVIETDIHLNRLD
jgi:hypothetical protein